jgi:hypothetical protein
MSVEIIRRACTALARSDEVGAREILRTKLPVSRGATGTRKYSKVEVLRVFRRDHFICRYTGANLVFGGALRLLSEMCPDEFPYESHWQVGKCHQAYWDLAATLDHVEAWSREGADDMSNWVTTSMTNNMRMGNAVGRQPRKTPAKSNWDGLVPWFAEQADLRPELLGKKTSALSQWRRAVRVVYEI